MSLDWYTRYVVREVIHKRNRMKQTPSLIIGVRCLFLWHWLSNSRNGFLYIPHWSYFREPLYDGVRFLEGLWSSLRTLSRKGSWECPFYRHVLELELEDRRSKHSVIRRQEIRRDTHHGTMSSGSIDYIPNLHIEIVASPGKFKELRLFVSWGVSPWRLNNELQKFKT